MLCQTPVQRCGPQRVSNSLSSLPGPEEEPVRHTDSGCSKLWFPKEHRGALGAGGCVLFVRPLPAHDVRAEREGSLRFEWVINTS